MNVETIKNRVKTREISTVGKRRYFSVLIPLVKMDERIFLLYEKRAEGIRQPGDVCFPGGEVEAGETVEECALRETYEEIGLKNIETVGRFDTLYEISGITMNTVVGIIEKEELENLNLNLQEVKEVFMVPLEFFTREKPYVYESQIIQKVEGFPYDELGIRSDYKWRKGRNIINVYNYEGYIIWGLTAAITKWFVEQVVIDA